MDANKILMSWISIGIGWLWLGVWYYYGVVLPEYNEQKLSMEQRKIDDEETRRIAAERKVEQEKLETEGRKEDAKNAYEFCQTNAYTNYQNSWKDACRSYKKEDDKLVANCRKMNNPYLTCESSYIEDKNWSCTLQQNRFSVIETRYKEDKNECLRIYEENNK